ncbi:helix-turn-helix domain-containing protein [Pseudonocardia parietis]|uniref:Transcriptional regulator of acetoin/glycerol metabolism n=1 Tax=Pseudonocardia parietis TaxID=570936 RepID=A0ABS4VRZ1_9PSEU|nr:helix-turn-helix domain-containing protein [Pseudonocardia parietis]MBP2366679.1 transcriptional regulator of acetoin/glycerol metabolism [Pseudonocardia parietis]
MDPVQVESARRRFLRYGRLDPVPAAVRPEVLASWERSRTGEPAFVGHEPAGSAVAEADEVFSGFLRLTPHLPCALALVGSDGVVRVRYDGDDGLAELLDAVRLTPGFRHGEEDVGTTAAALAPYLGGAARVDGPEHLHPDLGWLAEAAAVVPRDDGGPPDAVVVLGHVGDPPGELGLALARRLAAEVGALVGDRRHRRARAVHERYAAADAEGHTWVLATDGAFLLTSPGVRRLSAEDQGVLSDLVLAGAVLGEDASRHVDLPSGRCAELTVEPVPGGGCVVAGGPVLESRTATVPDAVRRQGSHVAPTTRRDYAADLRADAPRTHAEARRRANRELLSPYLRARHEVAAAVGHGRHQLLIGETGVGKRTLAIEQFRRAHPDGRTRVVDCSAIGSDGPDPLARVRRELSDRPHLLVLHQLNLLGPVAARRLDESLRTLVALPDALTVTGCVDSASVDATRPYGLLLRHFHETVRIPALRYRADELGEIALSILHSLSGGRSLRLSLQVVRVLEGYAWPGNVRELADVLRYVVARKPVGVIQAPDLPASCFAARAPRMSMLETAQCDAIIQALYESRGNRYKAAEMLGIARSSLYRKIDAFGISYIG